MFCRRNRSGNAKLGNESLASFAGKPMSSVRRKTSKSPSLLRSAM
jgi:hypothetical protein